MHEHAGNASGSCSSSEPFGMGGVIGMGTCQIAYARVRRLSAVLLAGRLKATQRGVSPIPVMTEGRQSTSCDMCVDCCPEGRQSLCTGTCALCTCTNLLACLEGALIGLIVDL